MTKPVVVFALAGAAVASGCEDRSPFNCLPYMGVGLVLTVLNDQTGEPICDAVVTAQAPDGGAPWTISVNRSRCTYIGSGSGTYSIRAERTGFRSADLVVQVASTRGECPVAVETPVTVRLAALP
jgi:hypothetical protein